MTSEQVTALVGRAELLERAGGRAAAAILVADLDRFSVVNELRGDRAGDRLLAAAEEVVVAAATAAGGLAASLGADRWAITVPAERVTEVATALHRRIGHPVTVGVACAGPATDDPAAVLRAAEAALRQGKRAGGARTVWAELEPVAEAEALHRALRNGEFGVDYQPIVSIEDGRVWAVEALVRWHDPVRGTLLPARFLDRADRLGLLEPIGALVVADAVDRIAEWQHELGRPELAVTVNLAPSQLARPSLAGLLAAHLRRTGVRPSSVVFEVTEDALVDIDRALRALGTLRAMGARIALDDFGTGPVSLATLPRLPLDVLKIDRAFSRTLGGLVHDDTLTRLVREVASALGLTVVAEGVEQEDHLVGVVAMGCELAQGRLFAPAVPAGEIPEVLSRPRFWWRQPPPPPARGR